MMNDTVGFLSRFGDDAVLVDDVLVVDAQHEVQPEGVEVDDDPALLTGVDNRGELVGTGCRLDNASELD